MSFRKILFWMHLTAGIFAGTVILFMSVTGVMLAFQRQITNFADHRLLSPVNVAPVSTPLPIEDLLQRASSQVHSKPTAVTAYNRPDQPVQIEYGRERVVFVDPYTGALLGEGSQPVRRFFRTITDWHRWLGVRTENRANGRAITGACNLLFLGIVLSGTYLWLPRKWGWQNIRAIVFFRRGLNGKAREFNWHNVTGFWCAIPLAIVVATAVVMSYSWANDALYRLTGNTPPAAEGPALPRAASAARPSRPGSDENPIRRNDVPPTNSPKALAGLNAPFLRAKSQDPSWRVLTMRLPTNEAPSEVSFTIFNGYEGRPDRRSQLVLARDSGELVRWEPFANNNAGRRLRIWFRFLHTGEAGGQLGQAIALIASAGGAFLMYTGMSLAIRRLFAWRGRRRKEDPQPSEALVSQMK